MGRTKVLTTSKRLRFAPFKYWCAKRLVFNRDNNGIYKVVAIDGGLGGQ